MNNYVLNFTNKTIVAQHAFQTVVHVQNNPRAQAARRIAECMATTIEVPPRSYRRMFVDITTGQPMFLDRAAVDHMCAEQRFGKNGLVYWNGEPETLHDACYSSVRKAIENFRFLALGVKRDCRVHKIEFNDKVCSDLSLRNLPKDHPLYGWYGEPWLKIYDAEIAKLEAILDEINATPVTMQDVTLVGEMEVKDNLKDHRVQIEREQARRIDAETRLKQERDERKALEKRMQEQAERMDRLLGKFDGRSKEAKKIKQILNGEPDETPEEPIEELEFEDTTA